MASASERCRRQHFHLSPGRVTHRTKFVALSSSINRPAAAKQLMSSPRTRSVSNSDLTPPMAEYLALTRSASSAAQSDLCRVTGASQHVASSAIVAASSSKQMRLSPCMHQEARACVPVCSTCGVFVTHEMVSPQSKFLVCVDCMVYLCAACPCRLPLTDWRFGASSTRDPPSVIIYGVEIARALGTSVTSEQEAACIAMCGGRSAHKPQQSTRAPDVRGIFTSRLSLLCPEVLTDGSLQLYAAPQRVF